MICETCKYYEVDYDERYYLDRMMPVKGEWCHKTGKPIEIDSSKIPECNGHIIDLTDDECKEIASKAITHLFRCQLEDSRFWVDNVKTAFKYMEKTFLRRKYE